ncbi:DEAD/DEAH box helicase [Vibrio parahaemolyticus]|nr:DEAD/DEAH box helicase [Vibrio parahaemolyticus]
MNNYLDFVSQLSLKPRNEQFDLTESMTNAIKNNEVLLAQADTGIGKTLAIAITVANTLTMPSKSDKRRKVIVATSTLGLCRDLTEALASIEIDSEILLSARNFFSKERIDYIISEHPEMEAELQNMRNWEHTIGDYIAEYGRFPDGIKESQVCQTSATQTDIYAAKKLEALASDVIITTHAMIACDITQSGGILNLEDYESTIIVDEADAFIDYLKSYNVRNINLIREFNFVRRICDAQFQSTHDEALAIARTAIKKSQNFSAHSRTVALDILSTLYEQIKKSLPKKLDLEDKSELTDFMEHLEWSIADVNRSSDVTIGLTSELKEPTISIFNPYFSRLFGGYLAINTTSAVLMSGTLSVDADVETGTEWVCKDLKLSRGVICKSFSPDQFGNLTITLYRSNTNMYELNTEGELSEKWIEECASNINKLHGKTLVITSSFKETEMLSRSLMLDTVEHKKGEKLAVVIKEFVSDHEKSVLVSPSAHTGVNLVDDKGRSVINNIVITRLGFAKSNPVLKLLVGNPDFPTDKIKTLKLVEMFNNINKVIRRNKQIIGRGIRNKDDSVNLHIIDNRFPQFSDLGGKYNSIKNSIPVRFAKQYQDATIINALNVEVIDATALDLLY